MRLRRNGTSCSLLAVISRGLDDRKKCMFLMMVDNLPECSMAACVEIPHTQRSREIGGDVALSLIIVLNKVIAKGLSSHHGKCADLSAWPHCFNARWLLAHDCCVLAFSQSRRYDTRTTTFSPAGMFPMAMVVGVWRAPLGKVVT